VNDLASQLRDYGRFLEDEITTATAGGVETLAAKPDDHPGSSWWLAPVAVALGTFIILTFRFTLPTAPADVHVGEEHVHVETSIGDLIWVEARPTYPSPVAESVNGLFAIENGTIYQSADGLVWAEVGPEPGPGGDQYIRVDRPAALYRIPETSVCTVVCGPQGVIIQRSVDGGKQWTSALLEKSTEYPLTLITGTATIHRNSEALVLGIGAGIGCGRLEFWTSSDGEEWKYLSRPWESCNLSEVMVAAEHQFFFYQLGDDGVFSAWRSATGVDWERVTVEGLDGFGVATFPSLDTRAGRQCLCPSFEIAFNGGRFLASLGSNRVYESDDGTRFRDLGESTVGRLGEPFGDGWLRRGAKHLEVSADGIQWQTILTLDSQPGYAGFSPDLSRLQPAVWSSVITLAADDGDGVAWVGYLERNGG
jgi:hypothetical protein